MINLTPNSKMDIGSCAQNWSSLAEVLLFSKLYLFSLLIINISCFFTKMCFPPSLLHYWDVADHCVEIFLESTNWFSAALYWRCHRYCTTGTLQTNHKWWWKNSDSSTLEVSSAQVAQPAGEGGRGLLHHTSLMSAEAIFVIIQTRGGFLRSLLIGKDLGHHSWALTDWSLTSRTGLTTMPEVKVMMSDCRHSGILFFKIIARTELSQNFIFQC